MSKITRLIKRASRALFFLISALLIIGIGASIALTMQRQTSKLPIRQYFSSAHTNAVWSWQDPTKASQSDLSELAEFMHLHQLNAIYVTVDKYAIFADGTTTAQKNHQKKQLDDAMERYVTTLGKDNIKVYAMAGDVDWSNPPEWKYPLSILKSVEEYNKSHHHARLAGVEFDIESYNQAGFAESSMDAKSLVLGDYLSMVDVLADQVQEHIDTTSHGLELGFAIPYWFDNENGNIPAITMDNKTGPTLYHLMDRLNRLPTSNVVVMSYRNAAKGNDGAIFHARTEVDYASSRAPRVKVLIGQETTDVEPAKITYYGQSATEMSNQIALIDEAFKGTDTYDGIAINDLAGYRKLSDE
jgi:hypothetical protein